MLLKWKSVSLACKVDTCKEANIMQLSIFMTLNRQFIVNNTNIILEYNVGYKIKQALLIKCALNV